MIKLLKKIWNKMNEPQNERVLIILIPCLAILSAGCILAPRFLYFAREAVIYEEDALPITAEATPAVSALPELAPTPAYSSTPLPSPSATVSPVETPAPVSETKAFLKADAFRRNQLRAFHIFPAFFGGGFYEY